MDTRSLEYNVIVVKWGDKFTAEHVNRLYRMAKRNITLPFNFYCYTEDPTNIYNEVNIIPLDESLGLEAWWWKLTIFKKNELKGINLFLDLDVVIQNNIDHLFSQAFENKLVLISHEDEDIRLDIESFFTFTFYNSSIMIWYNNENIEFYEKFIKNINLYTNTYRGIDGFFSYEFDQSKFIPLNGKDYYNRTIIKFPDDATEFKSKSLKIKEDIGSSSIRLFHNPNRPICVFNSCHEDIFYEGMEKFLL